MKKIFYILIPIISLAIPPIVQAEVVQSTSNSKTDVTIEVNGVKKEFHTQGNESVDWQSDDGKASVKINSKAGSGTEVNQTNNVSVNTDNERDTTKSSEKAEGKMEGKEDIFSSLKREIESFGGFFSTLFKSLFK